MTKISDLKAGDKGRILRLTRDNRVYRQKLLSMGLTPGTEFTVRRLAPLGDPIELAVRGFSLSLRKHEAELLVVERVC